MSIAQVAIGLLLLLAIWVAYTYNFMVHSRAKVRESFSGIDVQLGQRHNLVPNLVEAVRGYADHERAAQDSVTALRTVPALRAAAISATTADDLERAENGLARELRALLLVGESYPTLRASDHFKHMVAELAEIENEIQSARQLYNSNVEFYNSRAQSLPTAVVAAWMKPAKFDFLHFDGVDLAGIDVVLTEFAA